MVPVKGAGLGEVSVLCAGVGGVADECVYPCFVGGKPAWVEVADYGGGVDEVRPVEALVWGLGLECIFFLLLYLRFVALHECMEGRGGLLTDGRYSKSYQNPLLDHRSKMQQWRLLLPTWYRRLEDRFVYL